MKWLFPLLLSAVLSATELRPWFEDPLLPIGKVAYSYERFDRVQENGTSSPYSGYGNFLEFGLYASILDSYSLEVEMLTAETREKGFSAADGKITGRVLLMDDVSGSDPISLSAGATLLVANQAFVHDLNCFYHGKWEMLLHLAAGKEKSVGASWQQRYFGVITLGSANEGSMWMGGKLAFEKNSCLNFWGGLFLEGLVGFGSETLLLENPFIGYGKVQHRSIDVGGYLTYTGFDRARIKAEARFRPFAYNFPLFTGTFTIALDIPLAL